MRKLSSLPAIRKLQRSSGTERNKLGNVLDVASRAIAAVRIGSDSSHVTNSLSG